MRSPEFIVFAYPWNEQVGGVIVLHALCARLNELGHSAALWPYWKPAKMPRDWRSLRLWLSYVLKGRFLWRFDVGPFPARFAGWRDLKNAVVVYPEIVAGNPLGVRKVVRWLLYRPGAHTGTVVHGANDLIATYNRAFAGLLSGGTDVLPLHVSYENPLYRQWNFGERQGSCFMVRKGRSRPLDRHPADAICIDGLDHEGKATIFNQARYCYCYDLYTYYAVYAAICGCVPIIVPQPGLSEEEWQPEEVNRLGIAYGEQRVGWAESSRGGLLRHIADKRQMDNETVLQFVQATRTKPDW